MTYSIDERRFARRPLWLPELREALRADPEARKAVLRLSRGASGALDFEIPLPGLPGEASPLLNRYLCATVYNILCVYSGDGLRLFCGPDDRELLAGFPSLFARNPGLRKPLHIARRIYGGFSFQVLPLSAFSPAPPVRPAREARLAETLRDACARAKTTCCIGVDVGGSDIKTVASVGDELVWSEEYDWNPSAAETAEAVLSPILRAVRRARDRIADRGREPDAIGLSFPDVVTGDAVVGGETPKTKGIRENSALDYEREFAKFRSLKSELLSLCAPGGRVRIVNDGNMAAFTAAAELAAGGFDDEIRDGVIAHTLGTDLGTGWLRCDGSIPALPLELYDLVLDLGSLDYAALPPEDLRSTRNENSRLPGVRRYVGQSAAYRLAWLRDPGLLDGFAARRGEILSIPDAPEDLRKPCLEHLMRAAAGGNENAAEVFRGIGRNLAAVTSEARWLLGETPPLRWLFGRFVKSPRCFDLLREGFGETEPGILLKAADETLANTPLMRQLASSPGSTVAQFGQAVGAVYYALMPESNRPDP